MDLPKEYYDEHNLPTPETNRTSKVGTSTSGHAFTPSTNYKNTLALKYSDRHIQDLLESKEFIDSQLLKAQEHKHTDALDYLIESQAFLDKKIVAQYLKRIVRDFLETHDEYQVSMSRPNDEDAQPIRFYITPHLKDKKISIIKPEEWDQGGRSKLFKKVEDYGHIYIDKNEQVQVEHITPTMIQTLKEHSYTWLAKPENTYLKGVDVDLSLIDKL